MNKIVYTWPYDTAKPPKDAPEKSCYNCDYAIITTRGECTKRINGEYVHQDGMCPSAWWCKYWEEADDVTIKMNSIDWSNATKIYID